MNSVETPRPSNGKVRWLTRNVFAIGMLSLFSDAGFPVRRPQPARIGCTARVGRHLHRNRGLDGACAGCGSVATGASRYRIRHTRHRQLIWRFDLKHRGRFAVDACVDSIRILVCRHSDVCRRDRTVVGSASAQLDGCGRNHAGATCRRFCEDGGRCRTFVARRARLDAMSVMQN